MDNKIFSKVFLFISSLILIYIFYKSEIYWNSSLRNYYYKYYLISLILIIISIITFFLNKEVNRYFAIIISSLIISLYLFEIYLVLFSEGGRIGKQIKIYENKTGKNYDLRSRFEVYSDLKKKYNNVSVKVSPRNFLNNKNYPLPLSGLSKSKTIYCNENGYYLIYDSDRYGFNNPDSEWDKEKIEYLLIGDSFAHGACVNRPNDISSVLRKLSDGAVLNLGYSSNGPLFELATLKEYLNPNVKNIIWMYFEGNDLNDLENEMKSKLLKKYYTDSNFSQNLKTKQPSIDKMIIQKLGEETENSKIDLKNEFKKFIKLFNLRDLLLTHITKNTETIIKPDKKFINIISMADKIAKKNNSKIYFVYIPDYYSFAKNNDNTSYMEIKKIINLLDIPFIDIKEEILNNYSNYKIFYPFEYPGHFNEYGYRKIAEKIYEFSFKN